MIDLLGKAGYRPGPGRQGASGSSGPQRRRLAGLRVLLLTRGCVWRTGVDRGLWQRAYQCRMQARMAMDSARQRVLRMQMVAVHGF